MRNTLFATLLREDMCPALGVTEPAAIALACAKARSLSIEKPEQILVRVNSGIYKNAFTCGIPHTEKVGNDYAAALGCLAGDADKGLLVLDGIKEESIKESERMIAEGRVRIEIASFDSELFINAQVRTAHDICEVEIRHSHTNICYLCRNGEVLLDKREAVYAAQEMEASIQAYRLSDFFEFASQANAHELMFLQDAFTINENLADAAFSSERCSITQTLLKQNAGRSFEQDSERAAVLLTAAAAEARVLGLDLPAMSITGSGNHGIISTLPLYAIAKTEDRTQVELLRATALSCLITMYIKQYSGKLSAFCGCAVAAGTGMACALAMLRGGEFEQVENALYNMANSITGMICQGGNHGCVMKIISAVRTGISAAELGLAGARIEWFHGIGGINAEQTMRNIGYIADPGMVETEKAILDIISQKSTQIQEVIREKAGI